jgi:hypothetical protein
MKSFKIRENVVSIDGVHYGPTPSEYKVQGKAGRIQSISIPNRGQFFPIAGEFNDGTTPIVDETPVKKVKLSKTELKETSSVPVDVDGKPIKRKSKSK